MLLNKEKNFISAVIYVYNQEMFILPFLEQLNACLNERFEKYEVICVNDASTDRSVCEIKAFAAAHPECMVSLLHMSFYQGLELSMNAGVDLAIGDFVFEFDSPQISCPITLIQDIYFHSLKGFDIVSAVPKEQNHRCSSLFYAVFNRAAKTQHLLYTEAFRILSRRAINRVHSMSVMIPYRKAVYANCGLNMDALFFDGKQEMQRTERKIRRSQKETAVDALVMYTDLAYRCSMLFSMLMMAIVFGGGFYTVYIYFSGKPVAGWTTTMLFLAAGFLGLFGLMTIVIKYVSIILKLDFNRQKYMIESIEKIK